RLLFDYHVELHRIDEQVIGRDSELLKRGSHGLPAGLINVPGIDSLRIDFGDRPGQCMLTNALGELRTTLGGNLLRIVEPHDAPLGIENDGGGHYRTEE